MPAWRGRHYIRKQIQAKDVRRVSNPSSRCVSKRAVIKEIDVGILGTLLGRRQPVVEYHIFKIG